MKRGIKQPKLIKYLLRWQWDQVRPYESSEYRAACLEHLAEKAIEDIKKYRYGAHNFNYRIIDDPVIIRMNGIKDYWIQTIHFTFEYLTPNFRMLDNTTGAISDAYLYATKSSDRFTSEVRWEA